MTLAGRLLNVFAAPGDVFDEVAVSPPSTANWLVPALILVAVSWLGVWAVFSQGAIQQQMKDATYQAIQKQGQRTHQSEQQMQQAAQMAEKYSLVAGIAGGLVAPVFGALLTPFWGGLLVWLIGDKIWKGGFSYMKAVEIAGLANMIGALDAIIRSLLILVTGNLYASVSPVLLIKHFDPQNLYHPLLGLLNIMVFWALAVRSIGLARLARRPFAVAAAWIFGIWLLYTGFFVGLGLAIQVITRRAMG